MEIAQSRKEKFWFMMAAARGEVTKTKN